MGLKRRGPGRKQVLDLSDKGDSPRRSWQTKYQQICVEHNTQNGDSPNSTGAAAVKNPLSGLIANYNSDSDDDEDSNNVAGDLDSKVSDFLKEIQTIVPSGSSIVIPGQPLTTPGLGPEDSLRPAVTSAWQECYDDTTGYVYYWNMETNAVTWETPADYVTDSNPAVALNQLYAPAGSVAHVVPAPAHPPIGGSMPPVSKAKDVRQPTSQTTARNAAGRKILTKPVVKTTKRPTSDSEEEKIEMITSFGQSSEEDSEDEVEPVKKVASEPANVDLGMIGPRLRGPADGCIEASVAVDIAPPGVEVEVQQAPVILEISASTCQLPAPEPTNSTPSASDEDEGGGADPDEGLILSRLRTQALVLKELGGDLPDEVRHLIEPEPMSDFDKELEQMEKELKELTKVGKPVEKPTSFALIAGYGDDSDQDEEAEKTPPIPTMPVVRRSFESLPTVPIKNLFPIFEETTKPIDNTKDIDDEQPLTPPVVHSIVKPKSPEFTISALRPQQSREPTPDPELGVQPMIDSSMPVKAGKRKKRLDISTSAELVANAIAAKISVAVIVSPPEVPTDDKEVIAVPESLDVELDTNSSTEPARKKTKIEEERMEERKEYAEASMQIEEKKVHLEDAKKEEDEATKHVEELAQLISEKVKFLGEGKEPVSPVQIMAIQIETLFTSWHKGALSRSYLSKWLSETWEELRRLESAAAPQGWACQWDRSHKRYYYMNISSGDVRWEYPSPEELEQDASGGIVGGEQAMEICTTPPRPATPPPRPPTPPLPQTPPPPTISAPRDPSPPPAPRISVTSPTKKGKKKSKTKHNVPEDPPLPPLPPVPPPPPPPPPVELPPLPASPPAPVRLTYGEPGPPGVDPVDLPAVRFEAAPPTEVPIMSMMHPMQAYMMPAYQPPIANMGAPMMDYSGYIMHTHMTVPAVIAKPPAKKHKAALHAALDSFYSDLATMEPAAQQEPVAQIEPMAQQEEANIPFQPMETDDIQAVEEAPSVVAKKKKTKKVAGLGLKKKGVSSLVAKWQQVQQEVRRDYNSLDDDDS